MKTSRRYELRLAPPLSTDLEAFAQSRGLSLGGAVRLLVRRGLEDDAHQTGSVADSAAALAALVAAEHAVLMVAAVLPEGQRRMRELASQATTAAEDRLALIRDANR